MNTLDEKISLRDKVVIITGAGKGIGFETAKIFSSLGCKLAVISRDREDLNKLETELDLGPDYFYAMDGDVSSPETVKNFVNETFAKYGKIDVLINNAGIRFRKSFSEITYAEWQHVLNVNLGSTFHFCQEVGRYMVEQKYGRIINMGSIVGTLGLPDLTAYAASKGAIISLTKSLALEWAKYNININVLAPGFCKTSYAENFKNNSDLYDFTIERTPMKKWGESSDIANACVFLASGLSNYVTGEVLTVDGGWSAW
jgi:NAD(P)-dependent dehydrogenase (short-subunit alcohol dehydrogenase family)